MPVIPALSRPPAAPAAPPDESARHYRDSLCRALGPAVLEALADPDVTEIYVNPSGHLYFDTRSQGRVAAPAPTRLSSEQILRFLNLVGSRIPTVLNAGRPQIQAELPADGFLGARLQGFVPPLAAAPSFNLRKPPTVVYTLDDYAHAGILSPRHREALADAVRRRRNILVAGGTASGKTTLVNAVLHEITTTFPRDRIVVLEDTVELHCAAPDHLALRTTDSIRLRDLVKAALRTSPDRIVVGEVRDEAALDLLDAWETGHPGGCATLHANDALGALNRLDRLAQRANAGPQPHLVGDAIHLVVMIAGGSQRRRVTELALVHGFDGSGYRLTPIPAT
ncbi:MAG TPA: P-type conjugative transfer ATPase TrbB [Thermoanaerobaculia bacterium]|nr:P-type conjugative transfer ATPase TrbB [Thermoanaerobaculia bacterium]